MIGVNRAYRKLRPNIHTNHEGRSLGGGGNSVTRSSPLPFSMSAHTRTHSLQMAAPLFGAEIILSTESTVLSQNEHRNLPLFMHLPSLRSIMLLLNER